MLLSELEKGLKTVRAFRQGLKDTSGSFKLCSYCKVGYRDNIFVKRSTTTVRFSHKGINPFEEIYNMCNMLTILDPNLQCSA